MTLTPQEAYLWHCARTWRNPTKDSQVFKDDAWNEIISLGVQNRMATLLHQMFRETGSLSALPATTREILQKGVDKYAKKAQELTAVWQNYMPLAVERDIKTMPYKGIWVSERLYQNVAMRPGHDLDILVPRDKIRECVALLESLEFGRYWPDLMPDPFYEKHHLHLELSLPDCWTWVEIHWAYDHPRTRLTIDYDAVLERTRPSELLGVPSWDPAPEDLLLNLSIHLVKHMVHLPVTYQRPDIDRIILAEGRLMYFLDIAEALNVYQDEIDWDLLVELTKAYGATDMLGAVLWVCHYQLDAPVPTAVLRQLSVSVPSAMTQRLMNEMAEQMLIAYLGEKQNPVWKFLLTENYEFVFRPIRLLDFVTYAFPGRDYLQRRYGKRPFGGIRHLGQAMGEYVRLGFDTIYYTVQRRLRPLPVFVTLDA